MTFTRMRRYEWRWELAASRDRLWPLVSDTDRFNRDTGLPPVRDARRPDEVLPAGHRHLRIRVAGVPVEWEGSPFQWVAPSRFGVVRRYRRGPLREMRVEVELEAVAPDRTVLTYRVQAWPRGMLGAFAVPLQIGVISRRAFGRAFRRYAEEAALGQEGQGQRVAPDLPVFDPDGLSAVGASRLRALTRRLEEIGLDPSLIALLAMHIERSDEVELARVRPYALADEWGADRRALLTLLLHAAREGLVDLRWEVICPLCHGAKEEAHTLEGLPAGNVHCDTCMVDFDADLERSVELTFVPSAGIRAVRADEFCVAGPRTTPHVLVQQLLAPDEERVLAPQLAPGRYRARTLDGRRSATFEVREEGTGEMRLALDAGGALRLEPPIVRPGARMRFSNRTAVERLLLIDITGWGEDAATAAEVLVLQEFRDLFSREVLAAGRSGGVGTLTVLFTDLKDSTSMYRDTERVAGTPCLVLKAGLHAGPCIAVTLNDRLDYFGSTVNVAARLAGLSEGNDFVMSDAVRHDPGVAAILAAEGLAPDPFRSPVRGLDGDLLLWRARWLR